MKIAIVTKTDASGGGASRVAADCVRLLRAAGHDVDHWVGYCGPETPADCKCLFPRPFWHFIWGQSGKLSRGLGLREMLTPHYYRFRSDPGFETYDLVHFHDTFYCFSPQGILRVANEKPVIWTMHDFTGVTDMCIYPLCETFPLPCTHCPILGPRLARPIRRRTRGLVQKWNRKVHQSGRVVSILPSDWMRRISKTAAGFSHEPVVIHNAIDLDVFRPQSKLRAKQQLGIPPDRPVVMIGAHGLMDPRKNIIDAIKALHQLPVPHSPLVLALGYPSEKHERALFEGLEVRELGFITDRNRLAQSYAATDCLLAPSKSETFGLQVAESMACGTPVVAYDTGALPELIDHRVDGYLARFRQIEDLAEGVHHLLQPSVNEMMRKAARAKAERCFSYDRFVTQHLNLYHAMLSGKYPGVAI